MIYKTLLLYCSPQPSGHRNRRDRSSSRPRRGDDWSDPWMRSKSPGGRSKLRGRKKSYTSHSSFSSSRYDVTIFCPLNNILNIL